MEITCAECGCLVERGVIVTPCDAHPACCCTDLPVRSEDQPPTHAYCPDGAGSLERDQGITRWQPGEPWSPRISRPTGALAP